MGYEYKDYFKELHFNESRKVGTDLNDSFNARDELNEVYTQAAKADEYEAKAKAWDRLMFEINEINDEATVKEIPSKIIRAAKITALSMVIKEYENGESNE